MRVMNCVCCIVALGVLVGCNHDRAEPLSVRAAKPSTPNIRPTNIPAGDEIESGIIELYCHPFELSDIPPTSLTAKSCEALLAEFSDAVPDPHLWRHVSEMGTIRVKLKNGTSTRLCWYFVGDKDKLLFSQNGIRYRRDVRKHDGEETLVFDARARRIVSDMAQGVHGK
jgi:hypothetical protein